MNGLGDLMHEVARQATAPLADRVDAAERALGRARRRRRARVVEMLAFTACIVVATFALLPAHVVAPPTVREPLSGAQGPDRLPAHLSVPPPWTPDLDTQPIGRVGMVASDGTGVFAVSADGGMQARIPHAGARPDGISLSADGSVLAWRTGSDDMCGGEQAALSWYVARTGAVRSAQLTPDGSLGGSIDRVLTAPDGAHVLAAVAARTAVPDGCVATSRLVLLDTATGDVVEYRAHSAAAAGDLVAWDADSATVVFSRGDGPNVGAPIRTTRCDLAGQVVDRFTTTRVPDVTPVSVRRAGGSTLRWIPNYQDGKLWSVPLEPDRPNKARSYDLPLRGIADATAVGLRDAADVIATVPVNYDQSGDRRVLVATRPGADPVTLTTADPSVYVRVAAAGVVANAQLGGPGPAAPSGWSVQGVHWWLRSYGGWLAGGLVLAVSAIGLVRRVRRSMTGAG